MNVSGDEDSETLYQPVYQVSGLAGAVFEIRAISDVITPDGTLRYACLLYTSAVYKRQASTLILSSQGGINYAVE